MIVKAPRFGGSHQARNIRPEPTDMIEYRQMKLVTLFTLMLSTGFCRGGSNALIRTAFDLRSAILRDERGMRFELQGIVAFPRKGANAGSGNSFTVQDQSGAMLLFRHDSATNAPVRAGDRIRATGTTGADGWGSTCAEYQTTDVLSCGHPPVPTDSDVSELLNGRHDYELTCLRGIVRDAFQDEIDPLWKFLVLTSGKDTIYLAFSSTNHTEASLSPLVGAKIAATGICSPSSPGYRRQIGRIFLLDDPANIRVLREPNDDPFDTPALGDLAHMTPTEIAALGRHRTRGRVLAVWSEENALVRDDDGRIHRIEFAAGKLPRYGQRLEAVGLPETDLYRINLTRAIWRALPDEPAPAERISCLSADELLMDKDGRHRIQTYFHGRTVRLIGIVHSLPAPGNGDGRLYMESGHCLVPVDASSRPDALKDVGIGDTIEVTGVYVVDTGNWHSNAAFPRAKGFLLVVRTSADIRILARPTWWKSGRLLVIVGLLLAATIVILVLREKLARIRADLRVEERTRLAVELHDSIAQNLTGVSLQIDTAERLAATHPDRMCEHLAIASKTLKSCREELRTCIWDLRNQTLNEEDMSEAIRKILKPHLGSAAPTIRFNVPRTRLSDNTAHTLLRIVRELATNAVRHGQATEVRVAGILDGDRLLFSVRDNGSGFDPDNSPGASSGHFGLQGVRERLRRFGGTLSIESAPGRGTRAAGTIVLPAHGNRR